MKILESILDKNYSQEEPRHILVDNDNLVATNGRMVIVKEIKNEKIRGLIINPKALKDKIEANSIYKGKPFFKGDFSYPNYRYLLPQKESWEKVEKIEKTFMRGVYQTMIKKRIVIDILQYARVFKLCEKEAGKICFYYLKNEQSPIFFKTDCGYTFGILPMVED